MHVIAIIGFVSHAAVFFFIIEGDGLLKPRKKGRHDEIAQQACGSKPFGGADDVVL